MEEKHFREGNINNLRSQERRPCVECWDRADEWLQRGRREPDHMGLGIPGGPGVRTMCPLLRAQVQIGQRTTAAGTNQKEKAFIMGLVRAFNCVQPEGS